MSTNKGNYNLLVQKLDQFIRKFYINKLIKGSLYTVGFVLAMFLVFSVLESQFYFDTGVRKMFFYGFIAASLGALSYWVAFPLTKYFHLGSTISHEQAANIIGQHFGDVKDKLLNVLQLKKQEEHLTEKALIEASIDQKTESIKLVPFKAAIDLGKNRKYLRYALPPALLLLVLLFAAPSLIKDSTHRIINNNEKFEKAAPYAFLLTNPNPEVLQYGDYEMEVKVEGSVIPNEVYIELDNFQYRLKKNSPTTFAYTFRNVQKNQKFSLYSGSVRSIDHTLKVLAKPSLSSFSIDMDYPSYTGRKDEVLQNIGDLVIPEGTKLRWNFNAKNTESVQMHFSGSAKRDAVVRKGNDLFEFEKRARKDELYKVFIANQNVPFGDSISYAINVIKDQFPSINVERFVDSTDNKMLYFVGSASDDYGLNTLTFNYQVIKKSGKPGISEVVKMKDPANREVQYDYSFDINSLTLEPGDNVSFFFEVKDNDAVNGSKSAKTGIMNFAKPTLEEFEEKKDENEEAIKDNLEETIKESKELQEEFKKLREKMLQKKEMDWQDKEEMEKLLKKQEELQKKLEEAKKKFDENKKEEEEFKKQDEEILKKEEKLEELMEKVLDPETQELMQKIQELMQELEKDQALEMMEQMEMDNNTLEKEMDRLLELYKQLEMEKEIKDQIKKLEELAEKQEKLSEETKNEEKPQDQLKEEQEKLNEEFEKLEEKQKELEKKNEELSPPKDMGEENEEQMEDIKEEMQDSQEQLEQQKNQGASKSQKSAAQKMKKMAGNLQSAMESGEMEQMEEDIAALRQLMENLVTLSFDQEDLISDFSSTKSTTPKYVELVQQQFKLKNDFQMIEDSLTALALRVDEIEAFVTEKVAEVKVNLRKSTDQLEERKVPEASENQRRTMTSVNDLALMLSESMANMQQQMSGMMPGTQMCNKPGKNGQGKSGKVPMDKITEGQQGLKEGLEKMQDKMKKGDKPGSKEFAEAAARQSALRKALNDIQGEKEEQGKASKELQEIIDQMDKIEENLVNKRMDHDLMKRQEEIVTRLLEAEKAERQREYDNKRKAEVGEDKKRALPPSLQEYLKKREAEIEMYKSVSPSLRPYYKYLVDEYYRALKSDN